MKPFKSILFFTLALVLLAACGPKVATTPVFQGDNPYAPQTGDSAMMRDDIRIDSSSVALAKSQPPQVMINFAYFQPTPCYQLRVEISGPDDSKHINLKA